MRSLLDKQTSDFNQSKSENMEIQNELKRKVDSMRAELRQKEEN